jgi:hypothetical protein
MANTYEAIATVEVGSGGAANIEFTSIPGTYTDLVVYFSVRNSAGVIDTNIQFNGSTANLSDRYLYGTGSAVGWGSSASSIEMIGMTKSTWTANTFGNVFIYIPNYTSSNNKSISVDSVNENNDTEAYAMLTAGLWSNSAAITSIKLLPASASNFVEHSTATLYGIKNS